MQSREQKTRACKPTKQREDSFTSGLQWEWSRPLCSMPQVGRLKGPKLVACDDQFGNSPDDRNKDVKKYQNLILIHVAINFVTLNFLL